VFEEAIGRMNDDLRRRIPLQNSKIGVQKGVYQRNNEYRSTACPPVA
jgi:hypothetical protein